jgi:uncharacterized membrane protein
MKQTSVLSTLLVLAALAGITTGCSKQEEPIGPVQKAGKAVDDAGEKVARGLRESLSKADEAAQKVAQSAENARAKIEDATRDATRDASKGLDNATEKVGEKVERAGEKIQEAAR